MSPAPAIRVFVTALLAFALGLPLAYQASYPASKAGVPALGRALNEELRLAGLSGVLTCEPRLESNSRLPRASLRKIESFRVDQQWMPVQPFAGMPAYGDTRHARSAAPEPPRHAACLSMQES
ncbi:hypothetical protein [Variovorax paradoxus]|uniref:Uncharacterized protein n=1 Tax=Variovorax paradoxus (strain EPS) TaxID=595537 RepID=E6V3V8_VARPE|nr:hypothetical protein [Variovorax paradoxus]ADU36982.1 hypothetical protein Varpa_2788 [Variovorax paradoxus EPS]